MSKVHITYNSWTDRTSSPHRRCTIEIDETTARCWRNSEHGRQLIAELKRVDADHEFDISALPEIFASSMRQLAECEQKSRRGEPMGEPYERPTDDGETFDERLARITEEMGPIKRHYYDCALGEMTDAEIVVDVGECLAGDYEWTDEYTGLLSHELGRAPTPEEVEIAQQAFRDRSEVLAMRRREREARGRAMKEGRPA